MVRRKGNICLASKGQKIQLKKCYKIFGRRNSKCVNLKRAICNDT
jgi:hypothetical protein